MGEKSAIEWTRGADGAPGSTWNPVRGCTKISAGCKHCYAERFAERWRGIPGHPFEQGFDVRLVPEALDLPLHWKKPRRVFVNSMSDLFHEDVPFSFVGSVFYTMSRCPQHTFQILTKRAKRMREFFSTATARIWADGTPLPNVELGVSVEDQPAADERIPELLATPAALRFLSCEPLLGPVDLVKLHSGWREPGLQPLREVYPLAGLMAIPDCDWDVGKIGWVIVGGESGPNARRCEVAWIRSIVSQCKAAGVPVFVKQLGAHVVDRNDAGFDGVEPDEWPEAIAAEDRIEHDRADTGYQGAPVRVRLRDRKGGDPSEWPEDLRVREFPRERP